LQCAGYEKFQSKEFVFDFVFGLMFGGFRPQHFWAKFIAFACPEFLVGSVRRHG